MVATVEPWAHGTVLRTPLAPDYWDVNTVRVEGPAPELEAPELMEMVDVLQDGLRHRRIVIEDEETGERLRPAFREAGWIADRLVMMLREGPPPEAPGDVVEVPFEQTRSLRLEWHRSEAWGEEEALHLESAEAVAARNRNRAFAVLAEDRPIGFVAVFSPPGAGAAEIDQAYVTPAQRGRGIGQRLISGALAAVGHHTNWIVADDEDRPKRLYQRIGFVPVWRRYSFVRTPL
ncbi:GNAT family N-acetyltransferase [Candidatus Solirubrobacter pratensis]|uniref:GNAT family N-acetyltransferase n=1 Tax=Candidatus Solirubrobacter pratensis TaxID=1298857 RepID=UPI0004824992|nr:GNAT family N-acetyltransferase [Candidatus Solirubrobacter pratensis]